MELKQLEYMIKIAEEHNITHAAEKIFISQSALNQQLLKLEKELGLQLFHRIKNDWTLTYAGEIYIEAAKKILNIKKETYKILDDIANVRKGKMTIAYTPERGSIMFSAVYPKFYKLYPEIKIDIVEARVKRMEQLLVKGNVDLAFSAFTTQRPELEYIILATEMILLAVPKTHPLAYLAGEESYLHFPPVDLKLFKNNSFVLMSYETRIRDIIDKIFHDAGFKPNILFESTSTNSIFNMAKKQICCVFIPQSYVDKTAPVVYFSLTPVQKWDLVVAHRKGVYLTKAEKDFIELSRQYYLDAQKV